MTIADRWLLPDGVEEMLPAQALEVEALRRRILDLYNCWGYELVLPPLIEFTESLLIGLGRDMDLQTFKVTDQLSGRTLAIRADITPQTARIDAHSLRREGPVRLCYAGSVLHTRPKALLASRSPIQVGAELYGAAGLDADIEIILLMLETLRAGGAPAAHLDLGHVGIYRALVNAAQLSDAQQDTLFDAVQRKALPEIDAFIAEAVSDAALAGWLRALPRLHGDRAALGEARRQLAGAPAGVSEALDTLDRVADIIAQRAPDAALYFDLSELRGFDYHTGLVFAAYCPGHGRAVANGGRYDHIGEVFGRARPATGFSLDLRALLTLPGRAPLTDYARRGGVLAEASDAPGWWDEVQRLRASGERVVCGLAGERADASCDRRLVHENGTWQLQTL